MKPLGIVRKLNDNGRIVIPMEYRRKYDIDTDDAEVEVFTNNEGIIIRKYEPFCIFCGSTDDGKIINNKRVCNQYLEKLKK